MNEVNQGKDKMRAIRFGSFSMRINSRRNKAEGGKAFGNASPTFIADLL